MKQKNQQTKTPGEKYTFELPKTSIKMFDTLEKILLVGSKDKRKDTVASRPQPHFPELAVHKNVKIRSHL